MIIYQTSTRCLTNTEFQYLLQYSAFPYITTIYMLDNYSWMHGLLIAMILRQKQFPWFLCTRQNNKWNMEYLWQYIPRKNGKALLRKYYNCRCDKNNLCSFSLKLLIQSNLWPYFSIIFWVWVLLGATLYHQPKLRDPQLKKWWFICVILKLKFILHNNKSFLS